MVSMVVSVLSEGIKAMVSFIISIKVVTCIITVFSNSRKKVIIIVHPWTVKR